MQTALSDDFVHKSVTQVAPNVIEFAKKQLEKYQPRDDYKELLELTIIFLGGVPERGIHFRMPGGLHRARWMAKAIYSLKIYLFRHQFTLSKREETGIKEICSFVVKVYIDSWFQASSASSAPRNDLQLLKNLNDYEAVNEEISKCAMKKIQRHLWYLSEELVALAFFDQNVPEETKRKMMDSLKNEENDEPMKRAIIDPAAISNKELQDFVTSNTLRFFKILDLPTEFLQTDVSEWKKNESYKKSKEIVSSLKVVNDVAERGVALMEEYNKLHTKDEDQKQYLLLLVKEYRSKYPDSKKSTLLS